MNSTWKTNSLFCTKQDSSEIDIRQVDLPDINNTTLEENIIFLIPPIGSPIIKTPIQWVLFNINKYWAGALIPPSHLPDINTGVGSITSVSVLMLTVVGCFRLFCAVVMTNRWVLLLFTFSLLAVRYSAITSNFSLSLLDSLSWSLSATL